MQMKNWRRAMPIALTASAATLMCFCLLVFGRPVAARPIQRWCSAELWEKADLVVIATVKSTQDVKNQQFDHPKDDTWVAIETVFDAVAPLLKGNLKEKTLTLRHYHYYDKQAEVTVIDGIVFVTKGAQSVDVTAGNTTD